MINEYYDTRKAIMDNNGWDEAEMKRISHLGQLWHNPMNFSNGDDLKIKYGWDSLFTDFLTGSRYYFRFHDYDLTDHDIVINKFRNCNNWSKYSKIWVENAPEMFASEAMFALVVTDMTVKGFRYEKKVVEKIRATGAEVVMSTPEDDLRGIDAYVNGKPIQIKSPGTRTASRRVA